MNLDDIERTLKIIINHLPKEPFVWRLDGGANLAIQNVNYAPNDLDIITNDLGISIFRKFLKKYIVRDSVNSKKKCHSIICEIEGFEVEINAYQDKKTDMFDRTKILVWRGLRVPTLPLKDAREYYSYIEKSDKVALIDNYLTE